MWSSDGIRWHRTGSTLAHLTACCLTAVPLPEPMKAISQKIPTQLSTEISLKITYEIFHSNIPAANKFKYFILLMCLFISFGIAVSCVFIFFIVLVSANAGGCWNEKKLSYVWLSYKDVAWYGEVLKCVPHIPWTYTKSDPCAFLVWMFVKLSQ